MTPSILAFLYSDGIAADRVLADLGYSLRDSGVNVGGLVQRNTFVRDRAKCDMEVEELLSGEIFRISEFRGSQAQGCRLDRGALAQAAHLLADAVARGPSLLIINKFGKVEAEGGGLRDIIATAAAAEIPILIGVPFRNLDQWRMFTAGLAEEAHSYFEVATWLERHRFAIPTIEMPSTRLSVGV
ncbi:DUF2478 domain-containing protein [Rhodoplanes sp. Z2-YC6860]|uniref:DUF2478 domain-containing protein n=1 Tax=Rhodoplanes sp. Z2-YC6860 TaxID=674703 RepID=UPI00078EF20D|nr:DUF2478 domain-containing protein [Rhodoplanes sp. Z2-YC6860]AMN41534.1 3-dehydroquinate dehydratase [Rhodoplanes sp. Z2-YC6860]